MANPTLGYIECPGNCGDRAEVCKTTRGKGRFLYTRHTGCCTDQKTSPAFQSWLWYETEWLPEMKPDEAPPGVLDQDEYNAMASKTTVPDPGQQTVTDQGVTSQAEEDAPADTDEHDDAGPLAVTVETDDAPKKSGGGGWVIALGATVFGIGMFLLSGKKGGTNGA